MRKGLLGIMAGMALTSLAFAGGINLKPYYKNLNYFDLSRRDAQLKYEGEFKSYLAKVLTKNEAELTDLDARNILYGTLFLTNINQAYRFGQISYEEMIRYGKLSPGGNTAREELLAREDLILKNLYIAKRLKPQDYRIDSWIGTHELYQEELQTGSVSNENFNKMFALASENVFSYTAMAIISAELTLSPEQQARMVELAALVSDNKIPCVKNEKGRCFERKLAPQTNEIGKLITGDIYLRDANQYVKNQKDPEGRRIDSGVSARVIYGLVKQKKFPNLKGLDWSNIYLKARVKSVKNLLWDERAVEPAMLDSVQFKRAYTCYACHAQ